MAIEQKRYEECSVAPGPDNDVIVGSVLVNWTDTMITTLKMISSGDWPQAYAAWNLSGLPKAIPFDSEVTILVESSDVMLIFKHYFEQSTMGAELEEYTRMPQWQTMMKIVKGKGVQALAMNFEEEGDVDFVKMRIVAICEAQETMERGVNERSNPSVFLA
jgi:hypothetical protein